MRLATFNINGVNKRLANLLAWLEETRPDVACLQELKATGTEFPADALRDAGYGAAWVGQKSWNGVAILVRGGEPIVTRRALPGDPADTQARYLEAAVNGVLIACLYAPNGNPQPGPKFDYKLAWLDRLIAHAASLRDIGAPVVIAGDYNIVPTDFDIYPSKSWAKNALVQEAARERYRRLLEAGWTDAIRTLHPDTPMYSFWDYFRQHADRDRGMRLDHLLLSPALAGGLRAAGIDRAVRSAPGASDHAPAWVELHLQSR
jgi:exodeoxyribonuclease III